MDCLSFKKFLSLIVFAGLLYACADEETRTGISITPKLLPLKSCAAQLVAGYTDRHSYFAGDELHVFIQSDTTCACDLTFYDIHDRRVFSATVLLFPQLTSANAPWQNGFGFVMNGKILLPASLASGIYFIEKKIPIIIKSFTAADITVVYPTNTINAYNASGGKSLYGFNSADKIGAHMVSFLRPMESQAEMGACIECLKWFPSLSGIKINYLSDLDLEIYNSIEQTNVVVIIGHSEYWTRKARMHFDKFVEQGGHALLLSGNTMWWQVRYSGTRDALICHRDAAQDPEADASMKTIRWIEPTLHYPILSSIGADFTHGGYGLKQDRGWDGYKISCPESPLLANTNFSKGDILSLPSSECDGAPIKSWTADGHPILDNDQLQFFKLELIGFDRGVWAGQETIPTFFAFQKTSTSGIVVNTGSMNWCSASGMGNAKSGNQLKIITQNAIHKLLSGSTIFSK